jgi:hypothetical protein
VLCALVAIVDSRHQGRGLSGLIIGGMARVADQAGLECLIAPVRPTWKERYPLTPLERYMRWKREDGLPFDPWIRLHHRLGAELLALAPRSLDVRGTVAEWEGGRAWSSRRRASTSSGVRSCPWRSTGSATRGATSSRTCGCHAATSG